MSEVLIEIQALRKSLDGHEVLKAVDLRLESGSILGLSGGSGSGKTTLLKILAGLLRPDGGKALVFGKMPEAWDLPERSRVGYLSQSPFLPPRRRVHQLLDFCSHLYPRWDFQLQEELLDGFGIPREAMISKLEGEASHQLGLILALAQRPKLLLLDNPFTGADSNWFLDLGDLIKRLIREEGGSVVIASSQTRVLENFAHELAELREGRLFFPSGPSHQANLSSQLREF